MTNLVPIPRTELSVFPVCLGGNVFGWTADKAQSEAVLDGFTAGGGNFVDTADVYSEWVPGNAGGESESIIGDWMAARGNRADIVVATKVSSLSTRKGLSRANILAAADDSLRRLKTDYIDVYYAHQDDPNVPMEETLGAFNELVTAGKVRYIAASNFTSTRLREAIDTSRASGFAEYVALQNLYNLVERTDFELDSVPVLTELGISAIPYFSLASGFLTGKYQPGLQVDSARAGGMKAYDNPEGWLVVEKLGMVAAELDTTPTAVALAWLRAQPTVSVPIASARTVEQLAPLLDVVELTAEQLALFG
jgi:aryl-alcohol dehydrogenase-like predicted oxidoreductase